MIQRQVLAEIDEFKQTIPADTLFGVVPLAFMYNIFKGQCLLSGELKDTRVQFLPKVMKFWPSFTQQQITWKS